MRIVSLAQECLQYGTDCERMPTAILRYFTTAGFVIGADGRIHSGGKVLSDNAQKVFRIPGMTAAYALYGDIGIGDDNPESPVMLDLGDSLREIVAVSTEAPADLYTYGRELEAKLRARLLKAQTDGAVFHGFGAVPRYGTGLARILLYGFVREIASEVEILFSHSDQVLTGPNVFMVNLERSNPEVWGSPEITQRLFRQPESAKVSLLDAAIAVQNYVRFCDSPEGREVDPFCSTIGGHVHIAAITPTCFHWLKPPILS
jgi:hypothetical protein